MTTAFLATPMLQAHGPEANALAFELEMAWTFEPGVVLPLIFVACGYAAGMRRLPRQWQTEAICFFFGWTLLVLALVSPLHRWGAQLFSAHMIQHELLMIGAAPLLVLGRPGLALLRVLSTAGARTIVEWSERLGLMILWHWLTRPAIAWIAHAFALWLWHVPSWFEATLHHEWAHALQHASFLGTALWFWHSIFRGPRRRADYGWGVFNLFFTAVHSSVLGALLTFAPRVWYPTYAAGTPLFGRSPLEDQQIGGLVMWVPGSLIYLIAALFLLGRWINGRRAPITGALPAS